MSSPSTTPRPRARQATHLEALVIFGAGVLTAWAVLAVGAGVGYGLAAVGAGWFGLPFERLSSARLWGRGPLSVAVWFAMAGYLIEALRFQGQPAEGRFYRAWRAAGRLRRSLFLVLAAGAVGVGLFAGLCWPGA
jgi:hypothetical protein